MSNQPLRKLAVLSFSVALALAGVAALLRLSGWLPQMAFAQEPDGEISAQAAVGTAFTYQGRLIQNGSPVSDTCDLMFVLYDAENGGNYLTDSGTIVNVSDGYFSAAGGDLGALPIRHRQLHPAQPSRCTQPHSLCPQSATRSSHQPDQLRPYPLRH